MCLRNALAVGAFLRDIDRPVSVIACGEQWDDGSLRPALEDYLGAGAVLSHLGGRRSPEAQAAVAAWLDSKDSVERALIECSSGKELVSQGRIDDIRYAGMVEASDVVPVLSDGAFRAEAPGMLLEQ